MASESTAPANGGGSGSLAAMLEAQHARDEAHKATVEDVVDEEDLKHLPPSSLPKSERPTPAAAPAAESMTPAELETAEPVPKPAAKKAPAFDVQSEELFPALGSGPKPAVPAAATWSVKKPSAAAAVANGLPAQPTGT